MPHAFIIHLVPNKKLHAHPYLSRYAHGLFYSLLEQIDPKLSSSVHALKRNPFTLWAKENLRDSTVYLRISILDDEIFSPLLSKILEKSLTSLKLGQDSYKITKILATPEGHRDADYCNWKEIIEAVVVTNFAINFLSPTVFTTSKLGGAKQHYTLLPEPRLIFRSLLRTYQLYSPQPYSGKVLIGLEHELDQLMILTSHDIKTKLTHVGKTRLAGFIGKASFRYQGSSSTTKQALGQLRKLAFYSGLGAKTPYGMGQIRIYKYY